MTSMETSVARRGRPRIIREPIDLGTPQTRAKLQPCRITDLGEDFHALAAQIAAAYHLLTADVGCRVSSAERVSRGKRELTDGQAMLVARYLDWVDECARHKLPVMLLLAMIVDNRPGPMGTLRNALELYDGMRRRR